MNSQEKLESHKRMYLWIQEQAKKNKDFDENYRRSDWEMLTNLYPQLLNLVEDLISHIESLVNREQELLARIDEWKEEVNYLNWLVGEINER